MWERVSNASTAGVTQLSEVIGAFNDEAIGKFRDMTTSIALLLSAVAVKNILFPVVFLMAAVKCSLPLARHASRLLAGFRDDSRKLREAIASPS